MNIPVKSRISSLHRSHAPSLSPRLKPLCAALLLAFSVQQSAIANPLDPTVINGQVSFATNGNKLTVTNTPGAIINWRSFSIDRSEVTHFAQQSAASSVMNRVTGGQDARTCYHSSSVSTRSRSALARPNGIRR